MPQKPRLDVRLHLMVSPSQKSRIEGAAERLRETLGRPVSEAQVVRAAIEQTDFSKLALTAAPAADREVQRERTTLTPEMAAIIEDGFVPFHVYAGEPKTLAGQADVVQRLIDDGLIDPNSLEAFIPRYVTGIRPPDLPREVKHAFVRWASDDPIDTDPPKVLTDWLEDEIVPDPDDVEVVRTFGELSEAPIRTDVVTPATPRDQIKFAEGLTLPPLDGEDRTGIPDGVKILAERPQE